VTVSLLVAVFVAFAATTVDDLIIVTALFTSSRATGAPQPRNIALANTWAFVAIVSASLAAAEGSARVTSLH
jgi:cadmium resistance protein CadD (predicted permease)